MQDIITPEEIKSIRAQYGLTQKSFALLLGIGPASIVRYEQGAVPSKANANLIRAARHPEFMAECIERDGDLIPERQRESARKISYAYVSLEPDEGNASSRLPEAPKEKPMNKMTEMYHYTLQQEVLNEQAANLACDMMEYMIDNGIDSSDRKHPVSLLLTQLLELKRALRTDEACDDVTLEQIRGHLKYMGEFIELLEHSEEVA